MVMTRRLRCFIWEFQDEKIDPKSVTVCAFSENVEGAIVAAVKSVAVLAKSLKKSMPLAELAEIVEEHLCTKPALYNWPAGDFVLYHVGGLGYVSHSEICARPRRKKREQES